MATPTDPRDALEDGVKQYLSELSDDDFAALVAEVRAPADDTEKRPKARDEASEFLRRMTGK